MCRDVLLETVVIPRLASDGYWQGQFGKSDNPPHFPNVIMLKHWSLRPQCSTLPVLPNYQSFRYSLLSAQAQCFISCFAGREANVRWQLGTAEELYLIMTRTRQARWVSNVCTFQMFDVALDSKLFVQDPQQRLIWLMVLLEWYFDSEYLVLK